MEFSDIFNITLTFNVFRYILFYTKYILSSTENEFKEIFELVVEDVTRSERKTKKDGINAAVVGTLVDAIAEAADSGDHATRTTLLSLLIPNMSQEQVQQLFHERDTPKPSWVPSSHNLKVAAHHSKTAGPGQPPTTKERIRSTVDDVAVDFALQFILSNGIERHAVGSRNLKTEAGNVHQVCKVTLTKSAAKLLHEYTTWINSAENVAIPYLSDGVFLNLVDCVSGDVPTCLKALDNIYCECLIENHENICKLLVVLCEGKPRLRESLMTEAHWIKDFLHHQFQAHVHTDSTCKCHSLQHALANTDDGKARPDTCVDCSRIDRFWQSIALAVDQFESSSDTNETKVSLALYADSLSANMNTYITHIMRKEHQARLYQEAVDNLKMDQVIIVVDFKMKLLSMLYRESQASWFGKHGWSLLGFMLTRRKTATEIEAERERSRNHSDVIGSMVTEFFDVVSDNATENGPHCIACISAVLTLYKSMYPHIIRGNLISDGAGCFSGSDVLHFLGGCGRVTGIRIEWHIVFEAGTGKTALDSHFCYIKIKLLQYVQDGRGCQDIVDALTTAVALSKKPISMSTALTIKVGSPSWASPPSTEGVSDASIRHYLYEGGTNDLKAIEVFSVHPWAWLLADNTTAATATSKLIVVITGDSIIKGKNPISK